MAKQQHGENITVAPRSDQPLHWNAQVPLPGGGFVSVTAKSNIELLAAIQGLMATKDALLCAECNGNTVRLMSRDTNGDNGTFTQYKMVCNQCNANYSFSTVRGYPMVVEAFSEKYRGWRKYVRTEDDNSRQSDTNSDQPRGRRTTPNKEEVRSERSTRVVGQTDSESPRTRARVQDTPPPEREYDDSNDYDGYDPEYIPF
jgi:hypothetical protein